MIMKGITPGAALVFLMTGPATNAATIATIWKTMGKRTTMIYLVVVAGTALASGLLLDSFFIIGSFSHAHMSHEMLPPWFQYTSAVAVITMLGATFFRVGGKHMHEHNPPHLDTESGCTCNHKR